MKSAGFELAGRGFPTDSRYAPSADAFPRYANLPPVRKHTLSKPAKTDDDGWWIVQMMPMLTRCAVSLRKCMIDAADAASRPDVGSSRKTTLGFLHSAMPSDSRRFCPPDSPLKNSLPARVCCAPSSPTSFSSSSTATERSNDVDDGRKSAYAYSRCSRAVRNAHSRSVCVT
eukprot:1646283-Prymnesium_polylepis.1